MSSRSGAFLMYCENVIVEPVVASPATRPATLSINW